MPEEASNTEVLAAVRPEVNPHEIVKVGGKDVDVLPLKRRWQHLFAQAALPMFRFELAATEVMGKAIKDGTIDFVNISTEVVNGELESDNHLDRAAAVVIASRVPGAEKDVEATVKAQIEWLADNATTAEMRALVEKQADLERLIQTVGERLPARFARSLNLAGMTEATPDLVKQHLTSFFAKLQAQAGSGS